MSSDRPSAGNLTGSLLIAHPSLRDPNFRRTILFLSHHSAEDGALGLVLNRRLRKTLGDQAPKKKKDMLGGIDLYYGGPVQVDHITVASLQWRTDPATVAFQSFMGRIEEVQIGLEWQEGLRAFVGYAGWSRGQLENEIAQDAWIVAEPTRELIEMLEHEEAWLAIMRGLGPLMRLLAEAPDSPELN